MKDFPNTYTERYGPRDERGLTANHYEIQDLAEAYYEEMSPLFDAAQFSNDPDKKPSKHRVPLTDNARKYLERMMEMSQDLLYKTAHRIEQRNSIPWEHAIAIAQDAFEETCRYYNPGVTNRYGVYTKFAGFLDTTFIELVKAKTEAYIGLPGTKGIKHLFYNYNKYKTEFYDKNPNATNGEFYDHIVQKLLFTPKELKQLATTEIAKEQGKTLPPPIPGRGHKYKSYSAAKANLDGYLKFMEHKISWHRPRESKVSTNVVSYDDIVADDAPDTVDQISFAEDKKQLTDFLVRAFRRLNENERYIFLKRQETGFTNHQDPNETNEKQSHLLCDLAQEKGISKERVRQIETVASVKIAWLITVMAEHAGFTEIMGRNLRDNFNAIKKTSIIPEKYKHLPSPEEIRNMDEIALP